MTSVRDCAGGIDKKSGDRVTASGSSAQFLKSSSQFFNSAPESAIIPPMDWLLSTPIAHRGLHDARRRVPENSLAAFEAARDAGFPIELDVRLSSDGAAAVFHDENLRRMTGTDAPLSDEDARSIARHRLSGTDQRIPLLQSVLDLVGGKVPLLIELKNPGVTGGLESAVRSALEAYGGRFAVQSFNPHSMAWFKSNAPRIIRGHLFGGVGGGGVGGLLGHSLQSLATLQISAPDFIAVDIRCLPSQSVADERERDMPVLGWTVRSHDEQRKALRYCDNYIFESIDPRSRDDET
jgi:glycerophosphoryl diester phosphodiesterase